MNLRIRSRTHSGAQILEKCHDVVQVLCSMQTKNYWIFFDILSICPHRVTVSWILRVWSKSNPTKYRFQRYIDCKHPRARFDSVHNLCSMPRKNYRVFFKILWIWCHRVTIGLKIRVWERSDCSKYSISPIRFDQHPGRIWSIWMEKHQISSYFEVGRFVSDSKQVLIIRIIESY